jgi:hypothetical protein
VHRSRALGPVNASIHKVDEHVRVADLERIARAGYLRARASDPNERLAMRLWTASRQPRTMRRIDGRVAFPTFVDSRSNRACRLQEQRTIIQLRQGAPSA